MSKKINVSFWKTGAGKCRRAVVCFLLLFFCVFENSKFVLAEESPVSSDTAADPGQLYAQSAVLMDGDSGRVLFEKNGTEERAMASTTKIMTCILALENGNLRDTVTVSANAASQPEVHLGAAQGETFYLEDLLYSLMLESHNDTAVMLAEHLAGSEEAFADMMNQKAESLGLTHTYYITPNGLDASDQNGTHRTTAEELARVMKYCIADSPQKEMFLTVTRSPSRQFSNIEQTRTYSCSNHNAFLSMMDGALSGKTGFTGDAGYCYVGALKRDNRTFIVALLGCGWPNHKEYKWQDTRKLMQYGLDYYQYRDVWEAPMFSEIPVLNGTSEDRPFDSGAVCSPALESAPSEYQVLLADWEKIEILYDLPVSLEAPVIQGEQIGTTRYRLHEKTILEIPVIANNEVPEQNLRWYVSHLLEQYFLQESV